MQLLVYDGSFEGLMSSIFEIYERKLSDVEITTEANLQPSMFGDIQYATIDTAKVKRVVDGLTAKTSLSAMRQLYSAFLSEEKGIENIVLQYIQHAFNNKVSIEKDYSNAAVLHVQQTAQKVHREKHRMEAFIRFQLTKDNIYYAVCEPDFNVLPLIENHFHKRYADQLWLIYDVKRKYGLYYDLDKVVNITMSFNPEFSNGNSIGAIYDENESLYQDLWKHYFKSVNIVARKNTKLHIKHMPRRYWKFLTEKFVS